ncbi:MAG: hypothetical protein H6Q05_744 [Acidobacteria bacterium]|jgi:hypothetical protein|nr:hypothetical protein [Acidobacteriota bacterium]
MPLSVSYGPPEPGIENRNKTSPGSALERVCAVLGFVYSLVHITYWLATGSGLMLLPWLPFWDNNYFLYRYPNLRPVLLSPYLKVTVVGLGIINLLIGFQEIVNFTKGQKKLTAR